MEDKSLAQTVEAETSSADAGPKPAPSDFPFKPDDVLSGRQIYQGRPHGLSGPSWLVRTVRKLRRRKPLTQKFLLWVIYRDWKERTLVVHLDPGEPIRTVINKTMESPEVRSVRCAELLVESHKSFGADYDPGNMASFIAAMNEARPAPADGNSLGLSKDRNPRP